MILHFDFSTGASGDKILGALIEVCESLDTARFEDVKQLAVSLVPGINIERKSLVQGSMRTTGITVHEDTPPHRHWKDIRETIERGGQSGLLSESAMRLSLKTFGAIAEAEATVHGVDTESVHFHEVGAADSIIDICCSSFLLDRLAPDAVFATPLALGFGTFVCSHGELSVPAPATAKLIEGLPVYAGVYEGELTTPTGAALARGFVSDWQPLPLMVPAAVGYGGGSRTIEGASNVVRALVGERFDGYEMGEAGKSARGTVWSAETIGATGKSGASEADEVIEHLAIEGCTLLETNIDHLSPEALAFACEELLSLGAMDVWQEPIVMKKGRLAVRLCVLASSTQARSFSKDIIRLTGSLGVRRNYVERTVVSRKVETMDTAYGKVAYKTALLATPNGSIKLQRPEYEDVARIAREQGLNFNKLYEELKRL
jgi:uncharacterized protein (TIGR00299 family) protein